MRFVNFDYGTPRIIVRCLGALWWKYPVVEIFRFRRPIRPKFIWPGRWGRGTCLCVGEFSGEIFTVKRMLIETELDVYYHFITPVASLNFTKLNYLRTNVLRFMCFPYTGLLFRYFIIDQKLNRSCL